MIEPFRIALLRCEGGDAVGSQARDAVDVFPSLRHADAVLGAEALIEIGPEARAVADLVTDLPIGAAATTDDPKSAL